MSRYNGLTLELNRRFADDLQFRAAYTLGKVVDTVPDATAVVPGNAGDDVKYASNPVDFDADETVGNNDQRHRFVASGVYSTNGLAAGQRRRLARADPRLVVQRDLHRAVRPALHGARRRRRSEQRRQHPQRHRAGHHAQPVPAAVDRHLRPAHRARHPGRPRRAVQLIWEAFNLFNRDNINAVDTTYYSVAGTTLTPGTTFGRPTLERRRADHAAGGEVDVLGGTYADRFQLPASSFQRFKVQGSGCRVQRSGFRTRRRANGCSLTFGWGASPVGRRLFAIRAAGEREADSAKLHSELPEMVIHVPVDEHAPATGVHRAECGVLAGEGGRAGTHHVVQAAIQLGAVGGEVAWRAYQQLRGGRRTLRERQHVNDQLLERRVTDRQALRLDRQLARRHAQRVTQVRDHLRRGEAAPSGGVFGREPPHAVLQRPLVRRVPDRLHRSPIANRCCAPRT